MRLLAFAVSLGLGLAMLEANDSPPAPSTPASAPAPDSTPPPAEVEPLLTAIRERRLVSFHYQGHDRVVEPHACGIVAGGEAVLHGYQIGGNSASGGLPGWRTFSVSKIGALKITEERFAGPRPDRGSRPRLAPLWAEVAAAKAP